MIKSIFTAPQSKLILCYLSEMRDFLRLNNWDIIFMDHESAESKTDDPDDDKNVSGMHSPQRNHYTMHIWLAGWWFDDDELTDLHRTDTVLHELLHANNRDLSHHWNECVEKNGAISIAEKVDWTNEFDVHIERMISLWSRSLIPYAPVWPGRGKYTKPAYGVRLHSAGR